MVPSSGIALSSQVSSNICILLVILLVVYEHLYITTTTTTVLFHVLKLFALFC